jgi:hypothetical protein
MNTDYYQTFAISSTEAGHSGIGTATPIDYNLGNILKNWVILVNVTVSAPLLSQPTELIPRAMHESPQLERAKRIWGEAPAGSRLSELVTDQRS